jgi:hypothetical protein
MKIELIFHCVALCFIAVGFILRIYGLRQSSILRKKYLQQRLQQLTEINNKNESETIEINSKKSESRVTKLLGCWLQERKEDREKFIKGEMSEEELTNRIYSRPQASVRYEEAEEVYGYLLDK